MKIKVSSKYRSWALFLVILISSIIYAGLVNIRDYPYDAGYYWTTADPVFENGFDIRAFPRTFRGYLFPVLVGALKQFLPGCWGWRLLAAVLVSVCFAFSLPFVLKGRRLDSFAETARMFLAYLMMMCIWRDLLQYPLSDFPAVFFLISDAALIRWMVGKKLSGRLLLTALVSGILLYAAYNTRIAYLFGGLVLTAVYVIMDHSSLKKILPVLLAMLAGAAAAALPQSMINKQYAGDLLPVVHTEFHRSTGNLQTSQVFNGLNYSKYETYAGEDAEYYPKAKVYFEDPVGKEILRRRNLSADRFSITTVLKLFWEYPLDMAGIYVRHLIMLMTPVYQWIYISDLYTDKSLLLICSILIWILAFLGLLDARDNHGFSKNALWSLAVCIPAFLQTAGMPETRFFLAVHVLCYGWIFVGIDFASLWKRIRKQWLQVLVSTLLIMMLWITVYGNVLSNNQARTMVIRDDPQAYGLSSGDPSAEP